MIGGKVSWPVLVFWFHFHQQIAGVQYLTLQWPINFVGIIQLLCNPDGYTLLCNSRCWFSDFLMQKGDFGLPEMVNGCFFWSGGVITISHHNNIHFILQFLYVGQMILIFCAIIIGHHADIFNFIFKFYLDYVKWALVLMILALHIIMMQWFSHKSGAFLLTL